jgi:hypothetical protein
VSNPARVSYVVEGKTDFTVLDALVDRFLGSSDYVPTQIQPPLSAIANHQGALGGGWRGVLKWCEMIGTTDGTLEAGAVLSNTDYLIIHVDADIAGEVELAAGGLSRPCPPAQTTCDAVRGHIVELLKGDLPAQVVLCVPAQCTETWVFAALHPDDVSKYEPLECRAEPERLLIGKPERLVRDKDGTARKQPDRYVDCAARVAKRWTNATNVCPEAQRFEAEMLAALSSR